MLSPVSALSSSFLNISIPVTTTFLLSSVRPISSTSAPTSSVPLSTLPVATVPLPVIEKISSIGIMNGLSLSLSGSGMYSSIFSNSSTILSPHLPLGSSNAPSADPLIIGVSSPGKSYWSSNSLTSISTRSSSSSSSTMSHLFRNTTMYGTPTCLESKMCSLVCGIGPSVAATTKMAPSICAAPVIMFFT